MNPQQFKEYAKLQRANKKAIEKASRLNISKQLDISSSHSELNATSHGDICSTSRQEENENFPPDKNSKEKSQIKKKILADTSIGGTNCFF